MRLFIKEIVDEGVSCSPAWVSVIRRVNKFFRYGFAMRIIFPWYKLGWHYDPCTMDHKWCRQYPYLYFFGKGYTGARLVTGWQRAEDLGL